MKYTRTYTVTVESTQQPFNSSNLRAALVRYIDDYDKVKITIKKVKKTL